MSEILWSPVLDGRSRLERFTAWLAEHDLTHAEDYDALWQWSVQNLEDFWRSVLQWSDLPHGGDDAVVLADDSMPGARWFPDLTLNYAEAMLRLPGRADDDVVVVSVSQSRDDIELTTADLREQVARARAGLIAAGVRPRDRVAAYAPNIPETLVLLLAAASIGAMFTSCAPEFGTQSVVDRWQQIEPTVILTVDGYRYGAKPIDRHDEVAAIRAALPSVTTHVWLPYLDPAAEAPEGAIGWADFTSVSAPLEFEAVSFDWPLYVLFSSGTTGLPKPIIHGHGGITIEHTKGLALHLDLGPDDRFFWFSTTGWMMWNLLISGLLTGSTIVMFDGNPAPPGRDGDPDVSVLWRLAERVGITYFGTSAPFLLQCRKAGLVPRDIADLSQIRGIGSTGAPLPAEGFRWVYDAVSDTAQLGSTSGGTDVCASFVGGAPTKAVRAGQISCRQLGCAVESYDDQHQPVIGSLGELVVTRPMPSMPVGFWGDADGSRYRASYFEDIPGVWRHGDWITISDDGSCTITGRSDATLNRGGVRLGTSEFYSVVESLTAVTDSLVVHLEDDQGGAGQLLLFVTLAEGLELDEDLRREIAASLRSRLSPRHVPDELHQMRLLPRTLSGKKLEVPVKKILQGTPIDQAAAPGALADPTALDPFATLRR
ncbi:acetoacetate--CoA ligase [Aeromicrobium sp. CF3.5]|uniref:acetoacetate--CoA ligase n=1 Tax=Aeromicrobium sp. CF3.5 TaxID=3373078 RepID=UPI003EE681A3